MGETLEVFYVISLLTVMLSEMGFLRAEAFTTLPLLLVDQGNQYEVTSFMDGSGYSVGPLTSEIRTWPKVGCHCLACYIVAYNSYLPNPLEQAEALAGPIMYL